MPALGLTPGDRRLFLMAGGVLLLLVTASVILAGGTSNVSESPSTYSTGSSGAKASYLLLEESGYRIERWERSLRDLPQGAGSTLVLAEPEIAPTAEERTAVGRFLEEGGTLLATGSSGAQFLPERRVVSDPVAGLTWARIPARSPSAITRAAPEITMTPVAFWNSDAFALPLYADGENLRVIQYPSGAGVAIWWASPTPLTNAGLREPGNLEFFLACLGEGRRILWDEYFHGHRLSQPASLVRSPLMGLAAQVGLFAAAVLFAYSRRNGPVIAPAAERRLSPLEFVRTLGSLYQRAGAASVAVDIAYQRFKFALTRRLGLSSHASIDDLEQAVRERWNVDAAFGDVLRRCETAGSHQALSTREALSLTRALHDYAAALSLFRLKS